MENFKLDEGLLQNMTNVWNESAKRFENGKIAPNFSGYFGKAKKDAT
jgi:hypothetical protein